MTTSVIQRNNAKLEPKTCHQCGRSFLPPSTYPIAKSTWAGRKYCGHDCSNKSLVGRERSEEHRRNISRAKKGVPNPKKSAEMKGRTLPPEHRQAISDAMKGLTREKNRAWKGENVTYAARHYRNQKAFALPADGCCEHCGRVHGSRRHDWAFLRHPEPHTENREDYLYLCKGCHKTFDLAARRAA